MRKLFRTVAAAVPAAVLMSGLSGFASAEAVAVPPHREATSTMSTAAATAATSARSTAASVPIGLAAPWAREEVRFASKDTSPWHIAHVRELQLRLKWVGLYQRVPTGYYGTVTRQAVRAYQARKHIVVSGMATTRTWKLLLQDTVRRPGAIPAVCRNAGWHACYDRSMHQVLLLHDGAIYNGWLVRGGGYTTQTRLGTHKVFYRDIDHWSTLYDSPMPYSQFFDGGEAFHGSRLMMNPFVGHSHGCVNMYVEDARQLWNLTHNKTLIVTIYGAWD